MKEKSVMFGVCSYDGTVATGWMSSMAATVAELEKMKIRWCICDVSGDCYIARARNKAAHAFLKSDFTHLLFIDTDMIWESAGVVKLLMAEKDLVFGAYKKKEEGPDVYPMSIYRDRNGNPETYIDAKLGRMVRAGVGPTGFMLIKRKVFTDIANKWPDNYYHDTERGDVFNFFHCEHSDRLWIGEDIDFCVKANEAGVVLWCVADINLVHIGRKKYECNYMRYVDGGGKIAANTFDYNYNGKKKELEPVNKG